MTRPEGEVINEVEAWLVNKIQKKGLIHLSPDEVATAYKSKSFPDEWRRATGSALPDSVRSEMLLRLNQCGRSKDNKLNLVEGTWIVGGEASGPAFLKVVASGEVEVVTRWLESKDRRQLMGAMDDQQRGCLHLAAKAGHLEVMKLLHDHGADLEARDRFKRTPLHLACEYGRLESTELLLGYDCQAGAEDASKRTALHLAAVCEEPQICRLLGQRMPALVSRLDQHRRTPLFYSVLNTHPRSMADITRQLLELQAEANARDSYGMAPLHYAAEEGKKAAVTLLLRHQADPAAKDSGNGRTPLMLAARHEGVRRELQKALDTGTAAAPGSNGQGANPMVLPPVTGPGRPGAIPTAGPHPCLTPSSTGLRAPLALGAPFEVLQERFVKIMERVQEGGIEQMEHIKRPHLFTGSWMVDVSSHQQLLGQTFKYVPGPEVCIRVFNMLRPPNTFPVSRGDEKALIAAYGGQQSAANPSWGGSDPYTAAAHSADDVDDLSQARRVELLRAIHDQKMDLDAKELQVEEMRRKVEGLQADVRSRGEPGELQAMREETDTAKRRLAVQNEALEATECRLSGLQGQNRVLQEQLSGEKQRGAELLADQVSVRTQLQALMSRRGEDQIWQEQLNQSKIDMETLKRRLEDQLREVQESKFGAEDSATRLRAQVGQLQAQLEQCTENAQAQADADRFRAEASELNVTVSKLSRDLDQVFTKAAQDEQQHRAEMLDNMRLLEGKERELRQLRVDVAQLPPLEAAKWKLQQDLKSQDEYWRKMFREYHLIGQAFFGGPPAPIVPSVAPAATAPAANIAAAPAAAASIGGAKATAPAGYGEAGMDMDMPAGHHAAMEMLLGTDTMLDGALTDLKAVLGVPAARAIASGTQPNAFQMPMPPTVPPPAVPLTISAPAGPPPAAPAMEQKNIGAICRCSSEGQAGRSTHSSAAPERAAGSRCTAAKGWTAASIGPERTRASLWWPREGAAAAAWLCWAREIPFPTPWQPTVGRCLGQGSPG